LDKNLMMSPKKEVTVGSTPVKLPSVVPDKSGLVTSNQLL